MGLPSFKHTNMHSRRPRISATSGPAAPASHWPNGCGQLAGPSASSLMQAAGFHASQPSTFTSRQSPAGYSRQSEVLDVHPAVTAAEAVTAESTEADQIEDPPVRPQRLHNTLRSTWLGIWAASLEWETFQATLSYTTVQSYGHLDHAQMSWTGF